MKRVEYSSAVKVRIEPSRLGTIVVRCHMPDEVYHTAVIQFSSLNIVVGAFRRLFRQVHPHSNLFRNLRLHPTRRLACCNTIYFTLILPFQFESDGLFGLLTGRCEVQIRMSLSGMVDGVGPVEALYDQRRGEFDGILTRTRLRRVSGRTRRVLSNFTVVTIPIVEY